MSVPPAGVSSTIFCRVRSVITLMWNEQEDTCVPASLAVQVTVVVPSGKVLPDGGLHWLVGAGSQASVTAGMENVTTTPLTLDAVVVMSDGHVMDGGCVSAPMVKSAALLVVEPPGLL